MALALLRSFILIRRMALHSRVITATRASTQPQLSEIYKCYYTTRSNPSSFRRKLKWMNNQPIILGDDLSYILSSIRLEKVSSQDACDILKCCGRENTLHTELIDEIWAVLKGKVELSIVHYNILLGIYVDREKNFEPVTVLKGIMTANIRPNRVTFDHLIRAFAVQGNAEGVTNTFEEMERRGFRPNDCAYNSLILAFANVGDVDKMIEFENLMHEKGFPARSETLNALLKGHAKFGRLEDINRTFDRFTELKIILLNKDVLNVMFELYVNDHHQVIEAVAARLHKSNELPSSLKFITEMAVHRKVDGFVHKLLTLIDDDDRTALAQWYLQALMKAPAEQIDEAVNALESHGITLQTHRPLFEVGLQLNSARLIRAILDDMKANWVQIEARHFWKLIELEGAQGTDAVLNVVHSMKKDFNVELDTRTIREVVLPCLNAAADPHLAFARLRTVESNTLKIACSLFARCLMDKNMEAAYEIAKSHRANSFKVDYFRNYLIEAFLATGDGQHFVKIITLMQISLSSFEQVLHETITRIDSRPHQTESLLHAFVNEGLAISPNGAQQIVADFKNELNENSIQLLDKLSSGQLSPVSLGADEWHPHQLKFLSPDELRRMIEIKVEEGSDTNRLNKVLFNMYAKEKNIEKVDELAKICTLGNREHCSVINMHLELGNTDQAFHYLQETCKIEPDFVLNQYMSGRLGHAMFKANYEWNEIIRIFTENKYSRLDDKRYDFDLFLGDVLNTGNTAQLKELLNVLVENNFMVENGHTAGFFVQAHLVSKDYSEAFRIFDNHFREKNVTSGEVPLMKALIEAGDSEKLENVFDILMSRHSKNNAVLSLAQSYIEMGNLRQAQEVIKNNLKRGNPHVFGKRCQHLYSTRQHAVIEGLLKATDGLYLDRSDIYYYLLLHYCERNKTQEALELWHKQQDEDEKPTIGFLQTLASHLKQNGIEVPFLVPASDSLPCTTRFATPFDSRILRGYEKTGNWNEFFQTILDNCDDATDDALENAQDRIQELSLLKLLQKQSLPLNEFKVFARKAAEKGVCGPLTVLWAHYFLTESPECSKLYDQLEQAFRSKWTMAFVGRYLAEEKNEEKLQQLLKFVKNKDEHDNLQAALNNIIFESHVRENRIQDALAMIDDGTVTVQQLANDIRVELKNHILQANKNK